MSGRYQHSYPFHDNSSQRILIYFLKQHIQSLADNLERGCFGLKEMVVFRMINLTHMCCGSTDEYKTIYLEEFEGGHFVALRQHICRHLW